MDSDINHWWLLVELLRFRRWFSHCCEYANSGSGYRAGIQTVVNVGVQTDGGAKSPFYWDHQQLVVVTSLVLPSLTQELVTLELICQRWYSMIHFHILIFLSNTVLLVLLEGKSATVNIVVGQGSSVIDFEFRYSGYAYGEGEILTVPIGGTTGIPTDTSVTFEEFQITVDKIFTDDFNSWSVGQLEVLDKFDNLFDGSIKDFRLSLNGDSVSIQSWSWFKG